MRPPITIFYILSDMEKRQFFLRKQSFSQNYFTQKSAQIVRKINLRQNIVKCIGQQVEVK